MAESHDSTQPSRHSLLQKSLKACQIDDVPLLTRALEDASRPASRISVKELLARSLTRAVRWKSLNVLHYLLSNGADASKLDPLYVRQHMHPEEDVELEPSIELLELLLSHGWDINRVASGDDLPFLWHAVSDEGLIRWCLEHGARVVHPLPQKSRVKCPGLLEFAAKNGTVGTFKLLKSRGAPLLGRELHLACRACTHYSGPGHVDHGKPQSPEIAERNKESYSQRKAMLRYLVDDLKLDVNALDQPIGGTLPRHDGTPLAYVSGSGSSLGDAKDIIWFLLDRGADPDYSAAKYPLSAMEWAKQNKRSKFIEAVNSWRYMHPEKSTARKVDGT